MRIIISSVVIWTVVNFLLLPSLQAQFSVSAEFRPRFEYRDGYVKLGDSTMTGYPTIPGRNRIILDYGDEQFTARFSIQHAYVFGDNNYSSDTITRNTVNIYEGWFRYAFAKKFAVKVGRTELVYDDGRLLGNSNWGPKGATHDVAMIQWENSEKKYRGDFGFAINNTSPATPYLSSYPLKNYKYMAYIYEQKKFMDDRLTVSLLGLTDVFQKPITAGNFKGDPKLLYGRFTVGGTIGFSQKKFKAWFNGFYQGGHFNDGRKLSAGFLAGWASYQIAKPFNFLVGYDWLSGNDYSDLNGLKTKSKAFSTLYPSTHGFYGYMDMFSSYVTGGNGAGLTDLYAKATCKINEKSMLELTYRYLGLAKGFLLSAASPGYIEVDKNLGSEVDLMFVYKPVKNFEINAAYCFFLPTETMERFNGLKTGTHDFAQYAYVMLTYKPIFFSSSRK